MTPTETVTETGDVTSWKKATETAKADEAPAGPTAASAPEPSASASISEPVKPKVRSATPRPVVRSSLGVGEQLRDRPHRGNRAARAPGLPLQRAGGRTLLGRVIASRFIPGRQQLRGRRFIWRRRPRFLTI